MTSLVFAAVLFAAACHAGWNALIKVGIDPLSTTTLIAIGAAAVSLVGLPFAGMLAPAAWPWLMGSVVIYLLYFAALIESYRFGDLGQVYPLARGAAPLLTAIVSALLIGEHLSVHGWNGIVMLGVGVLLLSAHGGRDIMQLDRRAVGYALLTALTICAYSVTDGIGARLSQNPQSYVLWLLLGKAVVLVPYGCGAIEGRKRNAAPILAPRAGRARAADAVLWHRAVGHDAGADRHRCRPARD
jgi:drug/metabolite transporter (DMT)-like permease